MCKNPLPETSPVRLPLPVAGKVSGNVTIQASSPHPRRRWRHPLPSPARRERGAGRGGPWGRGKPCPIRIKLRPAWLAGALPPDAKASGLCCKAPWGLKTARRPRPRGPSARGSFAESARRPRRERRLGRRLGGGLAAWRFTVGLKLMPMGQGRALSLHVGPPVWVSAQRYGFRGAGGQPVSAGLAACAPFQHHWASAEADARRESARKGRFQPAPTSFSNRGSPCRERRSGSRRAHSREDLALLQGNLQQAQGLFSLPADGGEAGAVVFVESTAKRTAETQSTQRLC